MGCGAICGASSPIIEICKEAEFHFMNLFQQVTPNKLLCSIEVISNFAKIIKLNPQRISLVLTQKLIKKSIVPFQVMERWKIILFGLDGDYPAYVNCLGDINKNQNKISFPQSSTNNQIIHDKLANTQNLIQNTQIIQHKVFAQIQKDIERTFPGYQFSKKSFENILKKLSNHFPVMGYTQGVNFIVGYFLIIGYSQFDTFWLFVHMAINRRYLLLGLYEDGFPLINAYISIFRNMLKRLSQKLYHHLYQKVQMFDESAWIFKWFMTCYLSSFPFQMCQFVFDLVFCIGGIGMVKFAISLVIKLQKHLLGIQQACDLTQFFSTLKQLDTFNSYLSIRDIIKTTYSLQILRSDLLGLQQLTNKKYNHQFYSKYIFTKFQQDGYDKTQSLLIQQQNNLINLNVDKNNILPIDKLKDKQSNQLINKWYHKLLQQRKLFKLQAIKIQQKKNQKKKVIQVIQQQITIQFIQPIKKPQNIQQLEIRNSKKLDRIQKPTLQHYDSLQIIKIQSQKKRDIQSIPNSPKPKSKNYNRYGQKKIKDPTLWDDQDEQQQNKDKISIQDQFFYIPKDIKLKSKFQQHKNQDILSQFSQPIQSNDHHHKIDGRIISPKAGSATDINISRSRLAKAGNSVLSSMSASGASGRSSTSSHNTIQKQNSIVNSRPCKCTKTKNQQPIQSLPQPKKYLRMKKKGSQMVQTDQRIQSIHTMRKRTNSSYDWMTSSDIPGETKKNMIINNIKQQPTQLVAQIQIHNVKMFKKNKQNKVDTFQIMHNCQNIIQKQISQCQSHHQPNPVLGEEQSCQSVVVRGNKDQHQSSNCDIKSVK